MKRFELFGNKKNIGTINGRMTISESQEMEFKELGIIKESGIIETEDGVKIPYKVGESEARVFQFHIPRDQWGKTYNLYSEKVEEGRNKVIFVPGKSRFEIWENHKGCPRKMVMRVDGLDKVESIVNKWNEIYESEISVEDLESAIR